jgi:hypothetical protein
MNGGRIFGVAWVLATALVLPAAAAAGVATSRIYADFATHGRLEGHYSKAELESALHDALVEGYGAPAHAGLKPSVERQLQTTGIAGAEVAFVQPRRTGAGLPFTGVDLGLIAAGGFLLLGLGRALRTLGTRE